MTNNSELKDILIGRWLGSLATSRELVSVRFEFTVDGRYEVIILPEANTDTLSTIINGIISGAVKVVKSLFGVQQKESVVFVNGKWGLNNENELEFSPVSSRNGTFLGKAEILEQPTSTKATITAHNNEELIFKEPYLFNFHSLKRYID